MLTQHILYIWAAKEIAEHGTNTYYEEPIIITPQDLPDHEATYEEEHAIV